MYETWSLGDPRKGDELDLGIGVTSILACNPISLAARFATEGTNSNDELPAASDWCKGMCSH